MLTTTKDELLRLSLQFFGEPADDDNDADDGDDYDDYADEDEEDEEDEEDDDSKDSEDGQDEDTDADGHENTDGEKDGGQNTATDTAKDGGQNTATDTAKDGDTNEQKLIKALKANGYTGDSVDDILASLEAERTSAEKERLKAERQARMSAGKGHLKGTEVKGSSGNSDGFTARDVEEVRRCLGPRATTADARKFLVKQNKRG